MEHIVAFVPVLFNLLIIALVVSTIKKKVGTQGRRNTGNRDNSAVNNFSEMVSHYNSVNKRTAVNLKEQQGMTLRDDRSNDWMARQLRDEAIALVKVSDMFKLKQSHLNNCDAEFIKRFHESNCDAGGIDDGTHKKSNKRV
ncbi:MAG: hypothetical protein K5857_02315 [Lachnospiraceae bacterium]|nr:hypothetical protein [Lachnospiraceae bacterium]